MNHEHMGLVCLPGIAVLAALLAASCAHEAPATAPATAAAAPVLPALRDLGFRGWSSEPVQQPGTESIAALVQVVPATREEGARVEVTLLHDEGSVNLCGGYARCPLVGSFDRATELDCSKDPAPKYQCKLTLTPSEDGGLSLAIEGYTGFIVPIPLQHVLQRASPLVLAQGPLKSTGGNSSSETRVLEFLLPRLMPAFPLAEVEAEVRRQGVDPNTLPIGLARRIVDGWPFVEMDAAKLPGRRAEIVTDFIARELEL